MTVEQMINAMVKNMEEIKKIGTELKYKNREMANVYASMMADLTQDWWKLVRSSNRKKADVTAMYKISCETVKTEKKHF